MGQQQHGRQQQGAERIDMLERIETDAAPLPGGVVAEMVRDKAVGGLMKGDGDDQRQHPDGYGIEGAVQGQSDDPDRVQLTVDPTTQPPG